MTKLLDRRALAADLLNDLACRIDGALDFWTLACVLPFPDAKSFVTQHSELLRSLVVVIQAQLHGRGGEVRSTLDEIRHGADEWRAAFVALAEHGTRPEGEAIAAAHSLARLYPTLTGAIERLGSQLGSPVAYLEEQTDERRAYYRSILDALPETLRQARQDVGV